MYDFRLECKTNRIRHAQAKTSRNSDLVCGKVDKLGGIGDCSLSVLFRGDIMDAGTTPDLLNQLLAKTFAELGATGTMIHTILLRDRQFAGQNFQCEGFQAVGVPE